MIDETWASDKSSLARAWPIKPPAPVMRIFMRIVLVVSDVDEMDELQKGLKMVILFILYLTRIQRIKCLIFTLQRSFGR